MHHVIEGSLEALQQITDFVADLDEPLYQQIERPLFESSIGQHLRHIIDLYQAIMLGGPANHIDYDIRRRGAAVETDRDIGLQELAELTQWLSQIPDELLEQKLKVSTEVALSSKQIGIIESTFGRELIFASSHLVHHSVIMATIGKLSGALVDPNLGLAPATATFIRSQASA